MISSPFRSAVLALYLPLALICTFSALWDPLLGTPCIIVSQNLHRIAEPDGASLCVG